MNKIKSFVVAHKIWTGIIVIAVVFIGYKIFVPKAKAETRYVTTTVQKGTIVSAVTGSGQVESSNTIDLKPTISANVVSIPVHEGQAVKKGQTLFALDAKDATKALRDAELSLQVSQNDLKNAQNNYDNTKSAQDLALKDLLLTLNSTAAAVPDNANLDTNIVNITGSYTSTEQGTYTLATYTCDGGVCASYSGLETGNFLVEQNVPNALGTRGLFVTFTSIPNDSQKWYIDIPSTSTTAYFNNLKAYNEKLASYKQTLDSATQTITADQLTVAEKENAVTDAKQNLSDYYITAPFDGTIASITAQVGQSSGITTSSSGTTTSSNILGTIITNQKIATISLNEVDVAKIKLGEKATLTFDAIDGLSIAGEVVQIDSIGTVTQGVVTYAVKISLLTDDDRIKPGMSVSASIISATAQDALIVPSSAVKSNANGSYVDEFNPPLPAPTDTTVTGQLSAVPPTEVPVSVGISDDTNTEIISGVKEGDQIVARTITATAAKTTASTAPSLFGNTANRGAGVGALRGATTGR